MKPAFRKLSLPVSSSFVAKPDDMALQNPWHYHPEVELLYIYEAQGTRFIGDSVGSLEPGDLLLIGSNLPHTWRRDLNYYIEHPDKKPSSMVVQFLPDFLGKEFLRTPEFNPVQRLLARAGRGLRFTREETERLGSRFLNLHEHSPHTRILELLDLLMELAQMDFEYLSSEGFVNVYGELHHAKLNKVYEYSVTHFMERIPIEKVADLASLTPAAFCRFFKTRTGRTYLEYLTELRINYACKLLAEDSLNISEIGHQSGFQNLSLFNRQFKNLKSITPSEYQTRLLHHDLSVIRE